MISKMVDSTNFTFGSPLELSMRGRKPVDLMIKSCQVSMATDVHKGVLSQILLKKQLKMTESSNACQSLKITAKDLNF